MTDFDDDFDLEEPYPDEDLYLDYTKKKCSGRSSTGYNAVDARQCIECMGTGKTGEIDSFKLSLFIKPAL